MRDEATRAAAPPSFPVPIRLGEAVVGWASAELAARVAAAGCRPPRPETLPMTPETCATRPAAGTLDIPAFLDALITGPLRFSREEVRVLLAVALGRAQRPAALARYLGRDYSKVKATCRTLRACRVLTRTVGGGLVVQPDASRWHVPNASRREPGRGA